MTLLTAKDTDIQPNTNLQYTILLTLRPAKDTDIQPNTNLQYTILV